MLRLWPDQATDVHQHHNPAAMVWFEYLGPTQLCLWVYPLLHLRLHQSSVCFQRDPQHTSPGGPSSRACAAPCPSASSAPTPTLWAKWPTCSAAALSRRSGGAGPGFAARHWNYGHGGARCRFVQRLAHDGRDTVRRGTNRLLPGKAPTSGQQVALQACCGCSSAGGLQRLCDTVALSYAPARWPPGGTTRGRTTSTTWSPPTTA